MNLLRLWLSFWQGGIIKSGSMSRATKSLGVRERAENRVFGKINLPFNFFEQYRVEQPSFSTL
jgi:hypothetical protein